MSTPREVLTGMLRGALPVGVEVEPYARKGLTPRKPTVMLLLEEVRRNPAAPASGRLYSFVLLLVVPLTSDTGPADDQLDASLEDVLYAIEQDKDTPQWTECKRSVYDERLPAYEITIPVRHKFDHTA